MRKYLLLLLATGLSIATYAQTSTKLHKMTITMKSGEKAAFLSDDIDSLTFSTYEKTEVKMTRRFVTSNTVAVNFELQENCSRFYAVCVPAETPVGDIKNYVLQNKTLEKDSSYSKSFYGLEADKNYKVYALAFDINEVPGEVSVLEARTGKVEDDLLAISIMGATTTSITYKVTPKSNDIKYFSICTALNKHYEDCDAEDNGGDAVKHYIALWKYLASWNTGMTWQDVMKQHLVSGEKETVYERLKWNAEHIVIAFGMDDEGNLVTPIYTKHTETKVPKQSTNVITITTKDILKDGVIVDVKTTNDDDYYIGCQRKDFVDKFTNHQEMIDYLLYEIDPKHYTHHGNEENLTLKAQRANFDYYIIAVPLDNGAPAGEPIAIPFKTASH